MSDIKSVLSLLCQHLNYSINVVLKPEYFRLAKFNGTAENVNEAFWKALNALSCYAVKEKGIALDFEQHDPILATKLYFAYLQYSAIDFYASSGRSKNNRPLLLAFGWLLGTQNVMNIITRINLSRSVLGKECSYQKNPPKKSEMECNVPESVLAQIDNVLYLNNKVNYNIKEISELVAEQTRLVSKVHAASTNISGLPHLSVAELALIKRTATINKKAPSSEDRQYMKELSSIADLLDTHMKWSKKSHIFFEWMVTVVEEHNKSLSKSLEDIDWNEISNFMSVLHSVAQARMETVSAHEDFENSQACESSCTSRLLRTADGDTDLDKWLSELSAKLNDETKDLAKLRETLSEKLKEILRSIPSCVQVSF